MKVLYDYQMFQKQYVGGITRYFCELYKNFPPLVQTQVAILINENLYLKQYLATHIIPFNLDRDFKGKHTLNKLIDIINREYSILKINASKHDILHPTYYDPYIFDCNQNAPIIVTIHDMIHEVFGIQPETIANKRRQILESDHIIAISQYTKNDILRFYPEISPTKISVIYHGTSQLAISKETNPYGKYILFVGKREGYKNFNRFFKGISNLLIKNKDINLVCAGNKFKADELEMIVSAGVGNQVYQKLSTDLELNTLYRHASVFVFPSIYEGFGFPLLEAFNQGCPVCASEASCFPEIAEDAVCYFDPTSPESIQASVERVFQDKDYANLLVAKGIKRSSLYTWKKCSEETHSVYKSIYK